MGRDGPTVRRSGAHQGWGVVMRQNGLLHKGVTQGVIARLIVHGEALPFSGGAVESAGGLFLIEDKVVAPDALCFADHPAFSERTPERRPSWPRPILRKSARRFIVYL